MEKNKSKMWAFVVLLVLVLLVGVVAAIGWKNHLEHRLVAELDKYGVVMAPEADTLDEVMALYGGVPAYSQAIDQWLLMEYGWATSAERAERSMSANVDLLPFAPGSSVFLVDDQMNIVAKWYNAGDGDVRHFSKYDEPLELASLTMDVINALDANSDGPAEVIGPPLEFSLEDQDEAVHTQEEFLGAPLLVMSSDKAGSVYSKQWSRAMFETLDERGVERIRIVPVPQLGMAPEMAREMVRGMIRKDLGDMFALLDWESSFTEKYQFKEGHANYLLFDEEGVLVRKEHVKELDQALLAELVDSIADVMEAHGEATADGV